jgi:protein-S-isoprenylcysteine O-methyltransferase Ste14
MEAGPVAETERNQQVIQTVLALLGIALFVVAGLDHRLRWSSVPAALVLAADALCVAGLAFVFRVFQENGWAASTVQIEDRQPVIRSGPYAWVRHPMYSGSLVYFLATPIALGSPWALIPAVLVCTGVVVRLIDEERFLARGLAGYAGYMTEVPFRLVPGLW